MPTFIRTFCIIAFTLFALAGCGKSPRSVAQAFTENLAAGKYSEAKKYATLQVSQQIDMLHGMAGMFNGGAKELGTPALKFIFVSEQIQGNKAMVMYRPAPDSMEVPLNLEKIDGRWLVSQ